MMTRKVVSRRAWLVSAAAACALASGARRAAQAETPAPHYDMLLHKTGSTAVIGVVSLDPRFMLQVISTVPERDAWVRSLVARTNRIKTLHLDAPPPADAPKFAMASQPITREDTRFRQALTEELRKYYGIELQASAN